MKNEKFRISLGEIIHELYHDAVESKIAEVNVYFDGEKQKVEAASNVYHSFASQISNCGSHVLEPRSSDESEIWNDNDCFIEIIYLSPQTIVFENADDFSIMNADRILYNDDKNILYYGNSNYQKCVDYTVFTNQLQEYSKEIMEGYERLRDEILHLVRDMDEVGKKDI